MNREWLMQKAEAQHDHTQNQPAVRQGKGALLESPRGEQIAQLEAMVESSPQVNKLAQLATGMSNSPHMVEQRKVAGALHNSPHTAAQRQQFDKLAWAAAQREETDEALQPKVTQRAEAPAKSNNTGLPDNLKNGIESLSGISMDNVKVHYNSSQPAQLNALAYAQGTDIHVAPGQEQHLPHEAWHVVQQAQGRVRPTMQMKEGVPVNDDRSLELEADAMGRLAVHKATPIAAQLRASTLPESFVLQAVWNTPKALEKLQESANGMASEIVPTNISLQQEAKDDDGGEALRKSQNFSAVGYEFEFAQLAPESRLSDFGKKSHLHLATGPRFPLYDAIPFAVETDMGAVIELAMPPLLIPRNPESKRVDQGWVSKSMLKLERGLKSLARNSSVDLAAILKSVQTFFGLQAGFAIEEHVDVVGLGDTTKAAKYGHMEKNSRIRGKSTTAQANIVTTLKEAIRLSYDKAKLPYEIAVMKVFFDKKLSEIDGRDPHDYGIFIAQKISEIPYMFLDSLHGKSLIEQSKPDEEQPIFGLLQKLAGHENSRLEKNKVHARTEDDGPDVTRYTARSTVSRVKGRGYGWIKATLGQELHLFSPSLVEAAKELLNDKDKLDNALQSTVAYRAIAKYAEVDDAHQLMTDYGNFVKQAVAHLQAMFSEYRESKNKREDEKLRVKDTREQKEGVESRYDISSARPDTVIDLKDEGVAYKRGKGNDAVLVEIRKPTEAFGIKYGERTTNRPPRKLDFIAHRARVELNLMGEPKWKEAYMAANPIVNTNKRFEIEKKVFRLLAVKDIKSAYEVVKNRLKVAEPVMDIFWKKWFGNYYEIMHEKRESQRTARMRWRQRYKSGNKGEKRDVREEIAFGREVHRGGYDNYY